MKTETELRELDAWIGVNVFGMKAISKDGPPPTKGVEEDYFVKEWIHISASLPRYTTDPAAAMLVLEKCVEESRDCVRIWKFCEGWSVQNRDGDLKCESPILPHAICLFAKELFK